ncbi:PH domain-containing protein [Chryseobacterium flavum]|uniref:PH domain-containing protein n=1 Tax=Chryseobacterium flavum TaxID=415851 RepID=UPI0028B03AE3|nr:PH domain-containing protein [Chryseobacterium flavum]
MNIICAICGTSLTATDFSIEKNKLADGGYLCAECFAKAIRINKNLFNTLDQFYFAEITGMFLKNKIEEGNNQNTSGNGYAYEAPGRLDEIKDQIVSLNARLSIFANEEVKELENVLDIGENLLAIAECIYLQNNREGIIFATPRRVVFIDKKILGGVVRNEFPLYDIISVEHTENLLYSILKINIKGASAEFKLHNKSDGRTFTNVVNGNIQYPERYQQAQHRDVQAFRQDTPGLVQESVYNADKETSQTVFEQLEKLGKLRETGVLTEEEFTEQKKKLLDRL